MSRERDEQSREKREGRGGLQIANLLRPVLQDAQTRLVFRSQAIIVNEVGRYLPQEGDLDYPGKIERGTGSLLYLSAQLSLSPSSGFD
jgi:hypothetical protein